MNTAQTSLRVSTLVSRGRRGIDRYGWRALSKEVFVRSSRPALAPLAAHQLHRRAANVQSIDEILDLAFEFKPCGISIRPCQSRWEIRHLLEEVANVRPRAMLEIGTATGGSLLAFTRVSAPDAHVLSVDLPHGAFGGGYPMWKVPLYKAFATDHQRLDLIRGNSHSQQTFAEVEARLKGRPLDFLFIDGDHTYDGVQADFEQYKSLVRPGGLIAFHDIAPPHSDSAAIDDPGDVPQFWTDLTARQPSRAFIDPNSRGCFGIGVLTA